MLRIGKRQKIKTLVILREHSEPKDLGTDGTAEDEKIRFLTDMSYELTTGRG